jgi:hypothetical protein
MESLLLFATWLLGKGLNGLGDTGWDQIFDHEYQPLAF